MPTFKPIALNADVLALLTDAGLPTADLAEAAAVRFCGMWEGAALVGVVGVEAHGRVGLLRSLAVRPTYRGNGRGEALVGQAEAMALRAGIEVLYLLTVSSGALFARCGYTVVDRTQVPADIRTTRQYAALCPATCAVMRRTLA